MKEPNDPETHAVHPPAIHSFPKAALLMALKSPVIGGRAGGAVALHRIDENGKGRDGGCHSNPQDSKGRRSRDMAFEEAWCWVSEKRTDHGMIQLGVRRSTVRAGNQEFIVGSFWLG